MGNPEISLKEREREFSSSQQILVIFEALGENGFSNIPRWALSCLSSWCEVGGEERYYKPIAVPRVGFVPFSYETFNDLMILELNGSVKITEEGETHREMENLLALTKKGKDSVGKLRLQFPKETDQISIRIQEMFDQAGNDFDEMRQLVCDHNLAKAQDEFGDSQEDEGRLFLLRDQILVILDSLDQLGRSEISEEPLGDLDLILRVGGELPETMEYPKIEDDSSRRSLFPLALSGLAGRGLIEIKEEELPHNLLKFGLTDKGRERVCELTQEWPREVSWFRKRVGELEANAPETIPHHLTIRAAYQSYIRSKRS